MSPSSRCVVVRSHANTSPSLWPRQTARPARTPPGTPPPPPPAWRRMRGGDLRAQALALRAAGDALDQRARDFAPGSVCIRRRHHPYRGPYGRTGPPRVRFLAAGASWTRRASRDGRSRRASWRALPKMPSMSAMAPIPPGKASRLRTVTVSEHRPRKAFVVAEYGRRRARAEAVVIRCVATTHVSTTTTAGHSLDARITGAAGRGRASPAKRSRLSGSARPASSHRVGSLTPIVRSHDAKAAASAEILFDEEHDPDPGASSRSGRHGSCGGGCPTRTSGSRR